MRILRSWLPLLGIAVSLPSFAQDLDLAMGNFNGRGDGCSYLNDGGKVSYDVQKLPMQDEYSFEIMKAGANQGYKPMFGLDFKRQRPSKSSNTAMANCAFRFTIRSRHFDQKIRLSVSSYSTFYGWSDEEGEFSNVLGFRIMEVGNPRSSKIVDREVHARGEQKPIEFGLPTGRDSFQTRCMEKIVLEFSLAATLSTGVDNDLEKAQSQLEIDSLSPLRAIVLPCGQ